MALALEHTQNIATRSTSRSPCTSTTSNSLNRTSLYYVTLASVAHVKHFTPVCSLGYYAVWFKLCIIYSGNMYQSDEERRRLAAVPSPCTGLCTLDVDDVCMGCHRTVVEICNWLDYSEQQRAEAYQRIEQRRKGRPDYTADRQ